MEAVGALAVIFTIVLFINLLARPKTFSASIAAYLGAIIVFSFIITGGRGSRDAVPDPYCHAIESASLKDGLLKLTVKDQKGNFMEKSFAIREDKSWWFVTIGTSDRLSCAKFNVGRRMLRLEVPSYGHINIWERVLSGVPVNVDFSEIL